MHSASQARWAGFGLVSFLRPSVARDFYRDPVEPLIEGRVCFRIMLVRFIIWTQG